MESVSFSLSTLSPVHIGNGQELVPGFYLIDNGWLYLFDEMLLTEALSPSMCSELNALVTDIKWDSLLNLQRFFDRHKQELIPFAKSALKVLPGVEAIYKKRLDGKRARTSGALNKQTILQFTHNPITSAPYIPGSSIKGAIRTALLDKLDKQHIRLNTRNHKLDEKRLLGYQKVIDDPFKRLKVSDACSEGDIHASATIMTAMNVKRKSGETKGVSQDLTALLPMQYRCLTGTLSLSSASGKAKFPVDSLADLISQCNMYSVKQLQSDIRLLEQHGAAQHSPFAPEQNWLNTLKQQLLNGPLMQKLLSNQAMLFKLGRYAGAESKTLNEVRSIYSRIQAPTTTWLAGNYNATIDNMLPFGWILLELSPDSSEPLHPWFETQQSWHKENQEAREQLVTKRLTFLDTQRQEKEQKQAAQEEEKRLQQELEQMSDAQKSIYRLEQEFEQQKRFRSVDPQGHTRELGSKLNDTIADVIQSGNEDDKAQLYQLACDLCLYWQVDRKKNKKMKQKLSGLK